MDTIIIIAGILAAYLLGAIPSSVWIGRIFFGVDVRTQGSGNAGATNTMRVLGFKPGMIVLLIDALKGFVAVKLAAWMMTQTVYTGWIVEYEVAAALAAILGHVFPVYVGFKGGKGVATLVGVLLALIPQALGVCALIFFVMMLIFRYVSLSSITASLCLPFVSYFLFDVKEPVLIVLTILIALFIPLTHIKNIKRLFQGTESKFSVKKKKSR